MATQVVGEVNLCDIGWRPLLLTGFLVNLFRNHFADSNNIEDSTITSLWTTELDTSQILIESSTRWKPEDTETRPGIIIRRNKISPNKRGIDNKLIPYGPVVNANNQYALPFVGSHTIFCITKHGAESEKLAAEVYREIMQFGPEIRAHLNFLEFQLDGIDPVSKIKEAKESFVVPVTVRYAFQDAWTIVNTQPTVSRIDLAVFQP